MKGVRAVELTLVRKPESLDDETLEVLATIFKNNETWASTRTHVKRHFSNEIMEGKSASAYVSLL